MERKYSFALQKCLQQKNPLSADNGNGVPTSHVVPDSLLTKEFLSQLKTEKDVGKFLRKLHSLVMEMMLKGEMDVYWGYEMHSVSVNNSGKSRNGAYPKKIQTKNIEFVIPVPRDRNGYLSQSWF